jgi:uncharacterized membrane protein
VPEAPPRTADRLSRRVNANIDSIVGLHQRAQEKLGYADRLLDRVSALIGRPLFLVLLVVIVVLWIAVNALAPALRLKAFDPAPFAELDGVLTFAALATTTIVLIAQQRLARLESQRAHLDLQVNLLTEQKVTKVIHLLEELRRDLPMVRDRPDAEASELQLRTDTAQVLSALEDVGITERAQLDARSDAS